MSTLVSDYTRRKIRRQYETMLALWWKHSYEAYKAGEEWLPEYRFHEEEKDLRGQMEHLPEPIQTAFRYYLEHVEDADFGNVRVRQVPTLPVPTIAVRTTTDGDDGWLEIYTLDGQRIGVGRTYLELVGWGATAPIRAETDTAGFFPSFQARFGQTLWGK